MSAALRPGQVVSVWAVVTNSDRCEGRGHSVWLAYFWTRSAAEIYAKGRGVMGTPADVRTAEGVVDETGAIWLRGERTAVHGTTEEIEREEAAVKLRRAGLTARERELLGLPRGPS